MPMQTRRITYEEAGKYTWVILYELFPNCSEEEIKELSDYFDKWGEDVYIYYE